ncbi:hypothetical protein [Polaromonas sp.]
MSEPQNRRIFLIDDMRSIHEYLRKIHHVANQQDVPIRERAH